MRLRLLLPGAVLTACVLAWAGRGDATGHVALHLALVFAAFASYLVALDGASNLSGPSLTAALGLAVLWRCVLVMAPPLLSDDVYRYVWEGRIQIHGGNPYLYEDRPESERWAGLRDDVYLGVNHKEFGAIYPPLFELFARSIVGLRDSVRAMKAALVGLEFLTWAALSRILSRRGQPAGRLLVLAWSPLALVEIAGSGHNEVLGMLFLSLGLGALEAGSGLLAALACAVGFQAKLLPGLVGLAWVRRLRPAQALAGLIVAGALVLPYASAGSDLVRTLGSYAALWRFNETLFTVFAGVSRTPEAGPRLAAVAVLGVALVAGLVRSSPVRGALAVVVAFILCAPSVLPWYALWLLPLLVLEEAPWALLFTGTVALAYLVYPAWQSGEVWQVSPLVRALEYGPPLAVAGFEGARRLRSR